MLKINCVFKFSVERIKKVIKNVQVLTNKIIKSAASERIYALLKNINLF